MFPIKKTLKFATLTSFYLHVNKLSGSQYNVKLSITIAFHKRTFRNAVPHTMHFGPLHTFLRVIFGTAVRQ